MPASHSCRLWRPALEVCRWSTRAGALDAGRIRARHGIASRGASDCQPELRALNDNPACRGLSPDVAGLPSLPTLRRVQSRTGLEVGDAPRSRGLAYGPLLESVGCQRRPTVGPLDHSWPRVSKVGLRGLIRGRRRFGSPPHRLSQVRATCGHPLTNGSKNSWLSLYVLG
jgi:hypothetical protein